MGVSFICTSHCLTREKSAKVGPEAGHTGGSLRPSTRLCLKGAKLEPCSNLVQRQGRPGQWYECSVLPGPDCPELFGLEVIWPPRVGWPPALDSSAELSKYSTSKTLAWSKKAQFSSTTHLGLYRETLISLYDSLWSACSTRSRNSSMETSTSSPLCSWPFLQL